MCVTTPQSQSPIVNDLPITAPPPQEDNSLVLPVIGYVVDTFPSTSETFILREVLQLRADGVWIILACMHTPRVVLHEEARPLLSCLHVRPALQYLDFWRHALPEMAKWRFWLAAFQILREAAPGGRQACWASARSLPTGAWMASVFRREGVRHVHAHFLGATALAGRVAARLLRTSFSISIHGSDLTDFSTIKRGNVTSADFVITCTAQNRTFILDRLPGKTAEQTHLVYHGLDLAFFSRQAAIRREASSSPPDVPLILCVARLVPKKGIGALIQACGILRKRGLTFRCEIIGEGPDRAGLESVSRQCGVERQVSFLGEQSQSDIMQAYLRAGVFVLACRVARDGEKDGLPNVIVEALAMEVPVVATRVGAVEELVEDGETGLMAPQEDPTALADRIQWVLSHPEESSRLAAAGRRRVERDFDLTTDPIKAVFEKELCHI